MGCDTCGWTMTNTKNAFEICKTIDDALKTLPLSSEPHWEMIPQGGWVARAHFDMKAVRMESRILWVYFDSDRDYDPAGSKIIYNLGCWGSSELIVKTVCKAMLRYGRTFYERNDCDDEIVEIRSDEMCTEEL